LENGINLGEMNAKLLQKIEELTLYMIEMKNANEAQKELLEEQDQRLFNLEQKINQLSKSK
jgi:flagellar hook-associated protein FlgK